jgi:NAD(P)-dependent dehydrogenase (short-subunit alcohol dehydrogenase family)
MQNKPVALVTGANQGIGLQIAKDLAAQGFAVLVGSRDLARGEAAAKEVGPDAHALQLDVTDQASIATAAEPHPRGVWPPRRARRQRRDLEYENAAGHVGRGVFQVDTPEQRVPR